MKMDITIMKINPHKVTRAAKKHFNENGEATDNHILSLALEIVTGDNPFGEISIEINDIITLGYKEKELFEDEIMTKIAKIAKRDVDDIKCLLKDKLRYKGCSYAT